MADETAPALAEEQPFALEPGTPGSPVAADPEPASAEPSEPEAPASDASGAPEPARADRIAAIIRNGLSNSPISRDLESWQALETLLPGVVAAIISSEA